MALKKYIADASLYIWATLRMVLGFVFLWAFLDKLFGLGVSTCAGKAMGCSSAWINGGSPTDGFLSHATTGPFASFYHHLAGNWLVDTLFMAGLLVAGVGLLLGVWVRLASLIGIIMLLLMWSALLWPANTPGVDEHIIYALVLFGVALTDEHQVWGMRKRWAKSSLAKSYPVLK